MSAPLAAADPTAPPRSELAECLDDLSAEEQRVLAGMIRMVKTQDAATTDFDQLSFIHAQLKARFDLDSLATIQEAQNAVAPPMVETFPNAPLLPLPGDLPDLNTAVTAAIAQRFSSHNFGPNPLPLPTLATLLHHSYGVKRMTRAYNLRSFPVRAAPSAGGLQPIDLYVFANVVQGLVRGCYYYDPLANGLRLRDEGNLRFRVMRACIGMEWIASASVVCALVANMTRVRWKYSERAYRFVHVDAGILAENLYLIGTALGLNTCAVAAFCDDVINDLLGLDGRDRFTVLLFAVGPKPFGRPRLESER